MDGEAVKTKRFDKAFKVQAVKMVTEEGQKVRIGSITIICSLKYAGYSGIITIIMAAHGYGINCITKSTSFVL